MRADDPALRLTTHSGFSTACLLLQLLCNRGSVRMPGSPRQCRVKADKMVKRGRAQCAFLALVAGLCLVLPAHLVHFLLVQHAVCSEHGELVHGQLVHGPLVHGSLVHGESAPSRVASGASVVQDGDQASGARVSAAGLDDEHVHCALAGQARERLILPEAMSSLAGPGGLAGALGGPGAASHVPSWHLLLLAPKTSPPV